MTTCVGHHDEPHDAATGYLCSGCRRRLTSNLTELPSVAVWLHGNLQPSGGAGERVSGTREAPVPLRLDVLDMVGPTNGPDAVHDAYRDQTGLPNIPAVIGSWVLLVAEERPAAAPVRTDLASRCGWLQQQVDWIAGQPWVDDLLDDLWRLLRDAHRVAPWRPELLRDRQEACTRCGVLALVQHVADGKVTCERRFGGCGWSRPVTEYEFTSRHLRGRSA